MEKMKPTRPISTVRKYSWGILLWLNCLILSGCVSQPSRNYDTATVITYAELTLLYEREKMTGRQSDSSYKVRVDSFFASKGTEREGFKKTIDEISANSEVWKLFIQDVSAAMDTIRR